MTVDKGTAFFSNHRQWRQFVTTVHQSLVQPYCVAYPKAISALRAPMQRSAWSECKSLWMRIHIAVSLSQEAN
jgi:hypothetical protein